MSMNRVLIVDDEKFIRMGLKVILEQMDYDISEIKTCKNGREALEILKTEDFDLVLTDVRMPQVDGITLIKEIQHLQYKPEIIIISGYDEFSYAVEGLKHGAQGYILKPIDKKELKEALDKVERAIQTREDMVRRDIKLQNYLDQIYINELNYILLNRQLSREEIESTLEAIGLPILDAPFYVGILEICTDRADEYVILVKGMIQDYIESNILSYIVFSDKDDKIIMLLSETQHAGAILDLISEQIEAKCFLGISNMSKHMTDIGELYVEASKVLRYRIFEQNSSVLYYQDIMDREKSFVIPMQKIEKMTNMLGLESIVNIYSLLWEIFDRDRIDNYDISYVEETVSHLYANVVVDFSEKIPQKALEFEDRYKNLESVYNFSYIGEYLREMESYLADVNEYLTMLKKTCTSKNQIDMAIQFIYENYHRDLNMAYMANYVSLNYSYFSQAFSKHTGKYFSDFLKEVRIKEAKILLEDTDDKIVDISKKVGFQNAKHFMKSFKEIVGITPTEYRDKINNIYTLK